MREGWEREWGEARWDPKDVERGRERKRLMEEGKWRLEEFRNF